MAEAHYWLGMALVNAGNTRGGQAALRDLPEAGADGPVRRDGQEHRLVNQVTVFEVRGSGFGVRPRTRFFLGFQREHRRQPRARPRAHGCGGRGSRPASGRRQLVAVSKTFGAEHVRAAYAGRPARLRREQSAGSPAENRRQRPICRSRGISSATCSRTRRRKAGAAFAAIHSIDSVDLLRKVDAAAVEAGAAPDVLIQVDLAGEATKFGAPEDDVGAIVRAAQDCRAARLVGSDAAAAVVRRPGTGAPVFRAAARAARPAGRRWHRAPRACASCRWA